MYSTMSLTATDLQAIRTIVREEVAPLENKVITLENDVKEIYHMLAKMQHGLSAVAKHAGITLPR